jgi:hypothetical protein
MQISERLKNQIFSLNFRYILKYLLFIGQTAATRPSSPQELHSYNQSQMAVMSDAADEVHQVDS